jgi:hypothetical protein
MLAKLIEANHDTLDIMLLISVVLFLVAAVITFKDRVAGYVVPALGYLGAAFLAFALMFVS